MINYKLLKMFNFFLTVKQRNVAVLERFGRFHRILEPGLQFKLPIID
jgi:regulator of protease activity HflC (stomatin/prohibitin superfamily)